MGSGTPLESALRDREQTAIDRLSTAITHPTVAGYPEPQDRAAFDGLMTLLRTWYPLIFAHATVVDAPWRIVVEIPGRDESLLPLLLTGHFDVVPAAESQRDGWTHPPFSGAVADGFVWGRGSLDDKGPLLALLEAVESLLAATSPRRGLVIALGGDEEVTGLNGAARTAAEFREAGRRFHANLDEGSAVVSGMLRDIPVPVALVGTSEKGYLDLTITAGGTGGHAAMPPRHTAVGTLAQAIALIERRPFPNRRLHSIEQFFRTIATRSTSVARVVYRHPRLLWPVLSRVLAAGSSTDSLIRTTQAVTMAAGSDRPNVLPEKAWCTVNVRIIPGETVTSTLERFRRNLKNLPVRVEPADHRSAHDPVPETSDDHPAFAALTAAMAEAIPEALVTPFIVTSTTDSRWYADLSDAVLRFTPMHLHMADLERIHGTNERVSVANYLAMIRFYSGFAERMCWND